jgi:hydrogenase maturation protease
LLAGDDGFGVHVCRKLAERPRSLPGLSVEVIDAGLLGMSALTYFEDCERVIVVDALGYAGQAGRVRKVELSEISAPATAFSAHALDLNHLFHVLPIVFEGRASPAVMVVGAEIEPPRGGFSMQLSPPLTAAVDRAIDLIDAELAQLSADMQSRARVAS